MLLGLLTFLAVDTVSAAPVRRFPDAEPMWLDPDENVLPEKLDEYYSGLIWDGLDQTLFQPLHEGLSLERYGPSKNVNAWDEVPDSSWWNNRIGARDITPEEAARGACPEVILNPEAGEKWTVKAAKPNGANPGFIIKADDGNYYLLKMDGPVKPERATTADVFGSKVYWAAGYNTPCNSIIFFDRDIFVIDEEAEAEDEEGNAIPMVQHHIDEVLDKAVQVDGKLRASASLFIDGRPIGPWTYQGKRKDDLNDVVRHEDRREVRGNRILAAWLNHFDTREQNTLAAWVKKGDGGFVRHYYIDWGDCLGSSWDWAPDSLSRRFGYSYVFDVGDIITDFVTLGAMARPWEQVEVRDAAPLLGWYDAGHFDAPGWKGQYPNPAFRRMDPTDGAWMARILARFTDDHVRAMLAEGHLSNRAHEEETFRVLAMRRDKLLDHYLTVRSPLTDFAVHQDQVCFTDLAAQTGVTNRDVLRYETRRYEGDFKTAVLGPHDIGSSPTVCVDIGPPPVDAYVILDLLVHHDPGADPLPPARLHLYGDGGWRIAGIERPKNDRAPGKR
jgi:hypothetical protein